MSSQECHAATCPSQCTTTCPKSMCVSPYLTFPGNANEALEFYTSVFGGKFEKHKYSDCPAESTCATAACEASKDKIMHASLHFGGNCIMLADVCPKSTQAYSVGTAIHVNICMTNINEMNKVFAALADGGTIEKPLHHHFWGATYGRVVDKFGILWGLNCKDEVKANEPSQSQSSVC